MNSLLSAKAFFIVVVLSHLTVFCATGAQPDLVPTRLTAPASVITQHPMDIAWAVENQGDGEAKPNWHDRVYFSKDEVVGAGDQQLTQQPQTAAVAGKGDYAAGDTVTVPNVPAGAYYLILQVDAYNALYEEDEGNNAMRREIPITGAEILQVVALSQMPNRRLQIDFQAISGPIHHLERCEVLEAADWQQEPFYITEDGIETQDSIEGTGAVLTIYVSPSGEGCFYRIVAE